MLKIQKNKYWLGLCLSVVLLMGSGFAQDVEQEVKDNLSALMTAHVDLTLQSLKDSLDQATGQQQTIADLAENTEQIGAVIGDIYEIETGSQFLESWRVRTDYFDDYLMFISSGDASDRDPVLANLANADREVAGLLQTIVSGFSAADAEAQLNSITDLFLNSTEDYAAGNTSSAQTKEFEARTQIGVLSQSLGDGVAADLILTIVEEEPEEEIVTDQFDNTSSGEELDESEMFQLVEDDAVEVIDAQNTTITATTETSTTTTQEVEEEAPKRELVKDINEDVNARIFVRNDEGGLTPYPFSDVDQTHDYTAILDMKNRGIVSGYDDGTYRPDNPVNRAEFTKIVVGSVVSAAYGLNCFSDVSQEWFAAYVCTAKDQNIVGGYPDGTFKPGNEVNLAEAYKIVGETLFPGEALATEVWYQGYIDLAISRDYYLGSDLAVTASVTREQLATMVSGALAAQEG